MNENGFVAGNVSGGRELRRGKPTQYRRGVHEAVRKCVRKWYWVGERENGVGKVMRGRDRKGEDVQPVLNDIGF